MAAKVKWDRKAWWVITHYDGRRKKKRVGATKAHKREAEQIAKKINAALALGTFEANQETQKPLPFDDTVRRWLATYSPTFKPSYRALADSVMSRHLVPHFGSRDLRDLREADLLDYVQAKQTAGLAPATIKNGLSIVRRVCNLQIREGLMIRNPAANIGELLRRVGNAAATQTQEVEHWSRHEVALLLQTARAYEPRFAPLLSLLFATGMRRGEALGLQWADLDFEGGAVTVRRGITKEGVTTPKAGRARRVPMTPRLTTDLFALLAERRRGDQRPRLARDAELDLLLGGGHGS